MAAQITFKAADQNHLRSECKAYLIARRKVGESLEYTLKHDGVQIAQIICRDSVVDRTDTLDELFTAANEHFDKVKNGA